MNKESVAAKWVFPLRTSFTLSQHYEFIKDVEQLRIKRPLHEVMDEIATIAESLPLTEQHIMAKKAPVEVKSKAAKPKAPKAEAAAPAVPREPKVPLESKITWLVKENPKRAGSASFERFEAYKGSKTVEAFLEAGGTRADLAHDTAKEYIAVA